MDKYVCLFFPKEEHRYIIYKIKLSKGNMVKCIRAIYHIEKYTQYNIKKYRFTKFKKSDTLFVEKLHMYMCTNINTENNIYATNC